MLKNPNVNTIHEYNAIIHNIEYAIHVRMENSQKDAQTIVRFAVIIVSI